MTVYWQVLYKIVPDSMILLFSVMYRIWLTSHYTHSKIHLLPYSTLFSIKIKSFVPATAKYMLVKCCCINLANLGKIIQNFQYFNCSNPTIDESVSNNNCYEGISILVCHCQSCHCQQDWLNTKHCLSSYSKIFKFGT